MSWKIQIEGDEMYLEDLYNAFSTLHFDPKIYKDGENYYLEGSVFENLSDPKKVSSSVKTFLTFLPVVFNFKTERAIELLKVVAISYEDGKFKYVYDSEGNFSCRAPVGDIVLEIQNVVHDSAVGSLDLTQTSKDGQILGGLSTIESIISYLKTHSDSESLKNVAEYLKPSLENLLTFSFKFSDETPTKDIIEAESKYGKDIELAKWTTIRKIYETIRDDNYFRSTTYRTGLSFIEDIIGEETADNLYFTACNIQIHSTTTIKAKNYKKPKRIIAIFEAEKLISTLLSKYIEEKAKEIESS
ncbi:MAG: hypothetical protein ACP5SP_07795 [Caldisericum sp.]|uniref:hypothetical protein n=1 Tax=Caldisericum sp. TaxID=2499687 RepID=UPI003D0FF013